VERRFVDWRRLRLAQAPAALKPFVAEDAPVLVLEHVRVIDGTGDAAREDQRVVLEHGKILSVGPESDDAQVAGGREGAGFDRENGLSRPGGDA
jgi:hypothetical protein